MSDSTRRPIGELFSQVYMNRGEAVLDSSKFRIQLYGLFDEAIPDSSRYALAAYIKRMSGMVVETNSGYSGVAVYFERFFKACKIEELLDCVTFIFQFLASKSSERSANGWIKRVQFAFDTQNLAYEVDKAGGVHHKIDAAYAHSKSLTLACLSGSNLAAAHEEIEKAFEFLTQLEPDTKLAVVNVFLAAENVFKLTIGEHKDLSKGEVSKSLIPFVQKSYSAGDRATLQAGVNLANSFGSWCDACHPYRHGQKDAEVVAPPMEIAITLVTAGADYIRWLVGMAR